VNKHWQWRVVVLLVICCTCIACSSETGKKDEGAPVVNSTGAPAQSASESTGGPSAYAGAIDSITCGAISGWEWNRANPAEKINVDIFVDNKSVGTTPTSLLRPDLKDLTGTANPNYGFSWPIPPELKDGKVHVVTARISGGNQEVQVWDKIKSSFTCSTS
jgi:hypothetical protein